MSTYVSRTVACAGCGHEAARSIAAGINILRSALPREMLLAETFQRFVCERCDAPTLVDDPFSYVDFDRKQLFGVYPAAWEHRWPALELDPLAWHRANLAGDAVHPLAAELGAKMRVRAIFGLAALREKIVCFDAGLDDVALEALKLTLAASGLGPPSSPSARARLVAADETKLRFYVPDEARMLELSRQRHDAVYSGEAFASLRAQLSAGPYVDVGRLLVEV